MYSNFICLHQNAAYSRLRHARCAFTKIMFICNLPLNHNYHIRTEMYSLTSYVANFQTQMSSRKSEDDVFYTRKKRHGQSESRSRFFHKWKKGTSNQKPQRCVSFAPKFPPFVWRLQLCILQQPLVASQLFNEKRPQSRVSFMFSFKKWKTFRKLDRTSFVYFTVNKENCKEPA